MTADSEKKITEILKDQTHGATFLAREALDVMKLAASESKASDVHSFLREMADLGCRLISLRPSMSSPIANGVARVFEAVAEIAEGEPDVETVREAACRAADELLKVAERNAENTVKHVSQLIPNGAMVLTHSYSESCLRGLLSCGEKGIHVFATESRPLFEGRKMAESLRQSGIDATLITDAEAGHFMPEVQVALVGADTVLDDGSVVNKMGTYMIALAASDKGVPFYVACDSWKVRIESGSPELEEKSRDEVTGGKVDIPARNVYFDVTPARLINAIITEDGPLHPKEAVKTQKKWNDVLDKMSELA